MYMGPLLDNGRYGITASGHSATTKQWDLASGRGVLNAKLLFELFKDTWGA
jgi:hypothetical protein